MPRDYSDHPMPEPEPPSVNYPPPPNRPPPLCIWCSSRDHESDRCPYNQPHPMKGFSGPTSTGGSPTLVV